MLLVFYVLFYVRFTYLFTYGFYVLFTYFFTYGDKTFYDEVYWTKTVSLIVMSYTVDIVSEYRYTIKASLDNQE
jgi:hypothetical protein